MGGAQGELVILQVAAAAAGIFLLAGLWTPIVRKAAVGRSVSNLQNALTTIRDALEDRN
jgi:hypothetical protein